MRLRHPPDERRTSQPSWGTRALGDLISDSVFRNIDGAAIENYDCTYTAAWCDNTFENLSAPPLICQGNAAECP